MHLKVWVNTCLDNCVCVFVIAMRRTSIPALGTGFCRVKLVDKRLPVYFTGNHVLSIILSLSNTLPELKALCLGQPLFGFGKGGPACKWQGMEM